MIVNLLESFADLGLGDYTNTHVPFSFATSIAPLKDSDVDDTNGKISHTDMQSIIDKENIIANTEAKLLFKLSQLDTIFPESLYLINHPLKLHVLHNEEPDCFDSYLRILKQLCNKYENSKIVIKFFYVYELSSLKKFYNYSLKLYQYFADMKISYHDFKAKYLNWYVNTIKYFYDQEQVDIEIELTRMVTDESGKHFFFSQPVILNPYVSKDAQVNYYAISIHQNDE